MEQIIINGGKKLKGSVCISGAKNAALAIIPATILAEGVSTIENLPNINDIKHLVIILESLGAKCSFLNETTLKIDATNIKKYRAEGDSVRKIRASYYLLGALLSRFKAAEVEMPGGCDFGGRPTDQHEKGFKLLGATTTMSHGLIKTEALNGLQGSNILLDVVSVGATINVMLAAVLAEGSTTIENCAREPHVVDTANLLNMMGADIKGAGTNVIRINGVKKLKGVNYTIIPDQIEAGTYMIAAAITGGDITVKNIIPQHMDPLTAKLVEMGCEVFEGDDYIRVRGSENLTAANVRTLAYPGFPTDLQPQITALMATTDGIGVITESVWDNRFQYVSELNRLGANITVDGRIAVTKGPSHLTGAKVTAIDLRAGAALVLAALNAEGMTVIDKAVQVGRGYENIEQKLKGLGADITVI
ncbi:MAG: UDP-N-acetylglucosamine 1-carboxyvinyltransferase [Defluviitaleaceae bacterium]|nr:UDP-N-acetylglucosamine 1-carboxyvinyltransferase [Defluviitaleaceae bacterium]